jgi:hypothetical protein
LTVYQPDYLIIQRKARRENLRLPVVSFPLAESFASDLARLDIPRLRTEIVTDH